MDVSADVREDTLSLSGYRRAAERRISGKVQLLSCEIGVPGTVGFMLWMCSVYHNAGSLPPSHYKSAVVDNSSEHFWPVSKVSFFIAMVRTDSVLPVL